MMTLEQVARRLIWWKTPEAALAEPLRLVAQVMVYGTPEDLAAVREHFSESAFRQVLADPPAGVFDPRSWNYWHVVFGMQPTPELPVRQLPSS